jgi:hypothetical protein
MAQKMKKIQTENIALKDEIEATMAEAEKSKQECA